MDMQCCTFISIVAVWVMQFTVGSAQRGDASCNLRGYSLLEIQCNTESDLRLLQRVLAQHMQLHSHVSVIWRPVYPGTPAILMGRKNIMQTLSRALETHHGITARIIVHDLRPPLDSWDTPRSEIFNRNMHVVRYNTSVYHDLDEIYALLDAATKPNQSFCTTHIQVTEIGKSVEKRPVMAVKISSELPSVTKKRAILFECGIHAREWISPAVCTSLIIELLRVSCYRLDQLDDKEKRMKQLLLHYDWWFMPMTNPDGYRHTWLHDRFWRKNRAPPPHSCKPAEAECGQTVTDNDDGHSHVVSARPSWMRRASRRQIVCHCCTGVDLNRNFDVGWTNHDHQCSPSYGGMDAFSEPESRAIRDFVKQHEDRILLYISVHSYSQLWTYPFASDKLGPLPEYEKRWLHNLLETIQGSIKAHSSTDYTFGVTLEELYPASGTSQDWIINGTSVPMAIAVELPPEALGATANADAGYGSFCLAPDRIDDTTSDMVVAMKVISDELWKLNQCCDYNMSHYKSTTTTIKSNAYCWVFAATALLLNVCQWR